MSIYDNAGVALIPSGYKAGTTDNLYSVLPANGNGDFNATRGSSATRVNKDGFIESVATNVPRLDYPLTNGVVGDCPALLLEPSRTNQLQRTEEFDNSYWTKINSSIEANQIVSPDGSQTADKYTHGGSSSANYIYGSAGLVTSGTQYTFSVFVKKGTGTFVQMLFGSGAFGSLHQNFDIENGLIGSSSGGVTAFIDKYPNGWYRVGITDTCTTTQSSGTAIISLAQSNTASRLSSFTSSDNFYVWGAQVEQGSYPTSYISWDGSGTTTRSADICNSSGTSAEFNDSEGVLFAEIAAFDNNVGNARITIAKASAGSSERVGFGFQVTTNTIQAFISRSSTQVNIFATVDITKFNKIAFKYKVNDFSLFINGIKVGTDTLGNVPIGLDELSFDDNDGVIFYGKSKQLMTFKTALTDIELETLTSWDSFNAMAKGQLYTIE